MEPDNERVLELLTQVLHSPIDQQRTRSTSILSVFMGARERSLKFSIESMLYENDPEVVDRVFKETFSSKPSLQNILAVYLIEMFTHPDPKIRERAAHLFGYTDYQGVEQLNELLLQPNNTVEIRLLALKALTNIKQRNPAFIPSHQRYLQFLHDPDSSVRLQAILLLNMDNSGKFLEQFLDDPNPQVREGVWASLGQKAPPTEISLDWLVDQIVQADKLLSPRTGVDNYQEYKRQDAILKPIRKAISRLANPGPTTAEAVEIFTRLFFEVTETLHSRALVIEALEALGPAASKINPQLIQLLADPKTKVALRRDAARLLSKVGAVDKAVIPPLLEAFTNPANDRSVRLAAIDSIGELPLVVTKSVINLLKETLYEVELELGLGIAVALHRLEPAYTPAIDYVINAFDKVKSENLDIFLPVLGELGSSARPAIPNLVRLLTRSELEDTRGFAALLPFTLAKIDLDYGKEHLQQVLDELDKTSEAATHIKLTLMLMNTLGSKRL